MKWKKPSGIEIETTDDKETIKYCNSLGWEQLGEEPEAAAASGSVTLEKQNE